MFNKKFKKDVESNNQQEQRIISLLSDNYYSSYVREVYDRFGVRKYWNAFLYIHNNFEILSSKDKLKFNDLVRRVPKIYENNEITLSDVSAFIKGRKNMPIVANSISSIGFIVLDMRNAVNDEHNMQLEVENRYFRSKYGYK